MQISFSAVASAKIMALDLKRLTRKYFHCRNKNHCQKGFSTIKSSSAILPQEQKSSTQWGLKSSAPPLPTSTPKIWPNGMPKGGKKALGQRPAEVSISWELCCRALTSQRQDSSVGQTGCRCTTDGFCGSHLSRYNFNCSAHQKQACPCRHCCICEQGLRKHQWVGPRQRRTILTPVYQHFMLGSSSERMPTALPCVRRESNSAKTEKCPKGYQRAQNLRICPGIFHFTQRDPRKKKKGKIKPYLSWYLLLS